MTEVSRYDWLLQRNVELEKDITAAMAEIERKRQDYQQLQQVHEELRTQHLTVRGQLEASQKALAETQEALQQVESQYEDQVRNWRKQFEEKEKEAKRQFQGASPPRDMEVIRLQLAQELEVPHQQRVRQLEMKMQAEHKKLEEKSRQLEVLRVTMQQQDEEHKSTVAQMIERHRQEASAWQHDKQALVEEIEHHADLAAAASEARTEAQGLQSKLRELQAELSAVVSTNNNAAADWERALERQTLEASKARGECRSLQSQVDTLQRRSAELEQDILVTRSDRDAAVQKAQDAASRAVEAERSKSRQSAAVVGELQSQIETLSATVSSSEEARREEARRRMEADSEIENLRRRQQEEVDAERQAAKEHAASVLEEWEHKLARERQASAEVRRELEEQKRTARHTIDALRAEVTELQEKLEEADEAAIDAKAHRERTLQDMKRLQDETESIREQCDKRNMEYDSTREAFADLQDKHRALMDKVQQLQEDWDKQTTEAGVLKAEVASLSKSLDRERLKHAEAMGEAQTSRASEVQELKSHIASVEHKLDFSDKELLKQKSAYKKLKAKAQKKQKDIKARMVMLLQRLQQAHQEKQVALRFAEDSKEQVDSKAMDYERRSRELDAMYMMGVPHAPVASALATELSTSAAGFRSELRGINERLAAQTAQYGLRGDPAAAAST
mmetsp:Transcript_8155/g.19469  ORF Transcript_8155/g.19469 Transcript_8155/m.19469 type:complete len:678 (+) Transcript_8155:87-2120(+)